jgi:uncharacterized protein
LKSWKTYIKYLSFSLLGLVLVLLIWGMGIEPRMIDVKAEEAALPHLPPAWEGKRIALIADLQVGMWFGNTDTIRRAVTRLIEERPALVLIAGDFIYRPIDEETQEEAQDEQEEEEINKTITEIQRAIALLRPLTANSIETIAVFGNHDYAMGTPDDFKLEGMARRLREELEAAGVRVLINQAVAVAEPGQAEAASKAQQPLYVIGLGSHFARLNQPDVALAQIPSDAPRIVLMHNPQSFETLPAGSAPLALAAHTHGGQLRIPFMPEWTWLNYFKKEKVHADGWIDGFGQPGNRLYVNRGIGFSYLPLRLNCPPEVTIITLRRAGK